MKKINAVHLSKWLSFFLFFGLPLLLCFAWQPLTAQVATTNKKVTGTVKDEKGNPLAKVSVTEEGTKNGVVTNDAGFFTIVLKGKNPTLVLSSSGFAAQTLAIGNRLTLDIMLKSTTSDLDQVVVVGYGTQKKINNTGAVSSIGTKELVQSPVANISNSLVGRLPGLFATQSGGEPGNDGSNIRIRGVGTFSGNTAPLTLVDGIEVSNYNNIDPNEIETLTILKDASSTAVYGIRGANGVIIITTKRGKTGPPKISYSANEAFNSFISTRKEMSGADYATHFNDALLADSYVTGVAYTPRYTPTDIQLYANGQDPIFHPSIDWFATMFRKVNTQMQHNLNVSGGQKKVKYFISGGYFNQQGLFKDFSNIVSDFSPQSTYQRYNLRSNFNFEITDGLKLALDLSTQTEIKTGNNQASGTARVIGDITRASPIDGPGVVNGKVVNINALNNNPYVNLLFPAAAGGETHVYTNYINGSLRLDYDLGYITKGLAAHADAAIQTFNYSIIINNKNLITYMAYPINGGPINGGSVVYVPSGTETTFGFSTTVPSGQSPYNRRITAEGGLDYKRSFGKHNITALALYNQQKTYDPTFQYIVPKGYQSYVGRATYDYESKYLAEVNIGYNGTENFAPGKRFGTFPAYSIGWVPSKENFFPKQDIVTFLKFRASYGQVGNDQIGGNRFLYNPTSYTTYGSIYYFGSVGSTFSAYNGLREGPTGNPNVTWERATKQDLGMEMKLFKDKVSITADLWSEKRNNILATPQTISAITGLVEPATNLGRMQNKGYEGDIAYSDDIGKLHFRIGGNYSFARNKILFQDEIPNKYSYQNKTGQRYGQNYLLLADGIYNTWDQVNDAKRPYYSFNNNKVQPGDLRFKDVNGDGIIDQYDAVPVGYSNIPEITYGISLALNYKGFDFSILFQGVGNASLYYDGFQRNAGFSGAPPQGADAYLNTSWTPARYAAGLPINFPRFNDGYSPNNNASTFYLADASYLRLKNSEIGYTISRSAIKRLGITSCRIYANANNLITWKHTYQGIDPENTTSYTADAGDTNKEPYPLTRTINVGVNVNF
jgi:TonB-linked SusC/RagA family outer membrane protein